MNCIIQKQCHSTTINMVDKNTEPWVSGDAMITYEDNLALIVYGADCAISVFWDDQKIGACHAGWRGLTGGIINSMAKHFSMGRCYLGPMLHQFEIQRDHCYDTIYSAYGHRYFRHDRKKVIFDFKSAVISSLCSVISVVDERNTIACPELASWRRDRKSGDGTQNRLTIWRSKDGEVHIKLFYPGEPVLAYFKELM